MGGFTFTISTGLGLLALAASTSAQYVNGSAEQLAAAANLERYWSYGRSPPVYPTPQGDGSGNWTDAYSRARALVSQMTNDEKNNITYGHATTENGCSGVSGSVARLGFPGMCLQDAGNGVRATDGVNGYSSGIHAGASWNRQLAYQRAQHLGAEFRRKGVNVALGPVAGPLGRIAEGGRNWEGFSNDPYLAGELTYETIIGLQENVVACVKHWVTNEQETNRILPAQIPGALNQSVSSNLDDRTLHELYAWPFQDAVKAGVGSVMCVYNQVNGSYGCQNSKLMNGMLKGELGFQGFVVTDWGAQHSGMASAEAGLDMVMPSSPYWQDGNLTLMVNNGSLSQSRLDDMATRIVAAWYKSGQFTNPGFGMPYSLAAPHELVDARDPSSADVLLQSAIEGHVLVKNENGALPLNKPKFLSLFGYDAAAASQNVYSSAPFNKWAFGMAGVQVVPGLGYFNDSYLGKTFLSSSPWDALVPGIAPNGTLISGGGSGATTPAYIDAPFDAIQRQARADGTFLNWDFTNINPTVNAASDACLVFVNALASEGWDRPSLTDADSDDLVNNVATNCSNTLVVIHNAGVRLVDHFIDHPNVTAVIYAHLPGQDSGEALVQLLYGKQSFSGRLPYTVAKSEEDYGSLLGPVVPDNTSLWHTQDNFTEGLFIDYKHFVKNNIEPRYGFGHGLTYTTFNYSGLAIRTLSDNGTITAPAYGTSTTFPEGGDPALWENLAEVRVTVANTGSVAAAEVAQLYVRIPGEGNPEKVLRGFEKVLLRPNESREVMFSLRRKDLSYWDVVSQKWQLGRGEFGIMVGKSVQDIQLTGTWTP